MEVDSENVSNASRIENVVVVYFSCKDNSELPFIVNPYLITVHAVSWLCSLQICDVIRGTEFIKYLYLVVSMYASI